MGCTQLFGKKFTRSRITLEHGLQNLGNSQLCTWNHAISSSLYVCSRRNFRAYEDALFFAADAHCPFANGKNLGFRLQRYFPRAATEVEYSSFSASLDCREVAISALRLPYRLGRRLRWSSARREDTWSEHTGLWFPRCDRTEAEEKSEQLSTELERLLICFLTQVSPLLAIRRGYLNGKGHLTSDSHSWLYYTIWWQAASRTNRIN